MITRNNFRLVSLSSLALAFGFSACSGGGGGGGGGGADGIGASQGSIEGSVTFGSGSMAASFGSGDDAEPNNNLFQVRDLGSLRAARTIRGAVGSATDRRDFFRFGVDHAGAVKVRGPKGADLLVYVVRGGKGEPTPVARTQDGHTLEIGVGASDHLIVGIESDTERNFALSLELVAGFAQAVPSAMTETAIRAAVESLLPAAVETMPGELVLRFASSDEAGLYNAGMRGLETVRSGGGYHLMRTTQGTATLDNAAGRAALADLLFDLRRNLNDLVVAEPNYRIRDLREPNDRYYKSGEGNWHHKICNTPAAWDITTGNGVVVAVLDSGVVGRHPDLKPNVLADDGYDFVDNDTDAEEPMMQGASWHGTHVAGIIGAATNNEIGVAGVCWNTKILPVRVLGQRTGTSFGIAQGILYAAGLQNASGRTPKNKARVINMSLGSTMVTALIQDACAKAHSAGAILVAAAGNEYQRNNPTAYPAAYPNVIAVGSVGPTKQRAPYSNTGSYVDIAAPGGDTSMSKSNGVLSTVIIEQGGQYYAGFDYMQGTSMACPFVSGVIALMLAKSPNLTAADILSNFEKTAMDLGAPGKDPEYGYGLIDAEAALKGLNNNGGGGNDPKGDIRASTTSVQFGATGNEQRVQITASNGGNLPLQLSAPNANWLKAELTGTTTPAELKLSIDRALLTSGTNRATVQVISGSTTLSIEVTAGTPSNGGGGGTNPTPRTAIVQLIDANQQVIRTATTDNAGAYQLKDVSSGSYTIRIGVDANNDGDFDDKGDFKSADRSLTILPGENLKIPAITVNQN